MASDDNNSIYFCRRQRHNRYKSGVSTRVDELAKEYNLDSIELTSGGLFIDCGSNIGELGLWARERNMAYVSYEPEELEARCCDLNNYNGKHGTNRQALWNEKKVLEFYTKPNTADGSLFEIDGYENIRKIDAVRLDDSVDLANISGTTILKVEAEGAEPEVLKGAEKILRRIDYVAIDCGYERGLEKKHTFVQTNNFMVDHGFRLLRVEFKRVTALYENIGNESA